MGTTRRKPPETPGTRRSAEQGRSPVLVLAAGAAALAVLVFGVVVLVAQGDGGSGDEVSEADPGVAHVHGLGINPAGGDLYVATHHGTFRIPDQGEAVRLGESLQDTMGFTVVGADRFLGSGHPDVAGLQEGQPGLLGLIESSDGGETWDPVSLSGEADFHGLAFAHDRVYAWDATSGRFMVSADRKSWDTRSTVELYGFAVDPDDPDHVLGAGPQGTIRSRDGGRSWQPVEGPALVALSWSGTGIWGADASGAVHQSSDGTTWRAQGQLPGPPQAVLAHEAGLYAAAQDDDRTAIYRSDDQGRTWELVYRDPSR